MVRALFRCCNDELGLLDLVASAALPSHHAVRRVASFAWNCSLHVLSDVQCSYMWLVTHRS